MQKRLILILAAVLILIGGGLYIAVFPRLFARSARLVIQAGGGTIQRGGGTVSLAAGQSADILPGEVIQINGYGRLEVASASVTLDPGASLRLDQQVWLPLDGWLVELTALSGSLRANIHASAEPYRFSLKADALTIRPRPDSNTEFTLLMGTAAKPNTPPVISVGVLAGAADLLSPERSYLTRQGQGVTFAGTLPVTPPAEWGRARLSLYGADSAPILQAVQLEDAVNGIRYTVGAGNVIALPPSTYNLYNLSAESAPSTTNGYSFRAEKIVVSAGAQSDGALTLAEVAFNLIGTDGKAIPSAPLQIAIGDGAARPVQSGQALLTSAGTLIFKVAKADMPQLVQRMEVTILPGQRKEVDVRSELFGGASFKVNLSATDSDSVPVQVYGAGAEDGKPLLTFQSNTESPTLSPGKYILRVLTATVAVRFEAEIKQGQTPPPIEVKFGRLKLLYTDSAGKNRPTAVQIAFADQMERLGVKRVSEMGNSPAGIVYVVGLNANQEYTFPVGTYNVLVADSGETRSGIKVIAGQVTVLEFKTK